MDAARGDDSSNLPRNLVFITYRHYSHLSCARERLLRFFPIRQVAIAIHIADSNFCWRMWENGKSRLSHEASDACYDVQRYGLVWSFEYLIDNAGP